MMKLAIICAIATASIAYASPAEEGASLKLAGSVLQTTSGELFGQDGPAPEGCYWHGTAPFCHAGGCHTGYTESNKGSCGDGACCWTGYKALCCKA